MRILLIQTSFLGDTILSTPLIGALKGLYPNCELYTLTTPAAANLLRSDKRIASCLTFDKHNADRGVTGLLRKCREIRALKFDRCYALQRSWRTALLVAMSGIQWSRAFSKAALSFLFTERVDRLASEHDVMRNLSLLQPEGCYDKKFAELKLFAPSLQELSPADRQLIQGLEQCIVVAPGSVWATKRWDVQEFKQAADELSLGTQKVVIVGGPDEVSVADQVCSGNPALINLTGKISIRALMTLVSKSAVVLCNDSMLCHMAAAFGRPVVVVFCSTVPEFGFAPWRVPSVVHQVRGLTCRPCGRHGRRFCPVGTQACMKGVKSQIVVESVNELANRQLSGSDI